jgi:hypothetical protein
MPSNLTFDDEGRLEPTVENSNALAEGLVQAITHRNRVFLAGLVVFTFSVGLVVGIVAHFLTRYTGWTAVSLGSFVAIAYAAGALTGYDFANEAVKVTYEPAEKR